METSTLAATGLGHCDVGGETLAVATSGGDGEQRLARGQDCVTASLRGGSVDPGVGEIRASRRSMLKSYRQWNPSGGGELVGLGIRGGKNWVG
jgi:hypothetical protein